MSLPRPKETRKGNLYFLFVKINLFLKLSTRRIAKLHKVHLAPQFPSLRATRGTHFLCILPVTLLWFGGVVTSAAGSWWNLVEGHWVTGRVTLTGTLEIQTPVLFLSHHMESPFLLHTPSTRAAPPQTWKRWNQVTVGETPAPLGPNGLSFSQTHYLRYLRQGRESA